MLTYERALCILRLAGITEHCTSLEHGSASLTAAGVDSHAYWRNRLIARAIRRVYWF